MIYGGSRAGPRPVQGALSAVCGSPAARPSKHQGKSLIHHVFHRNLSMGPKTLVRGEKHAYIAITQFARACGYVPVGGHPDKRPDSRPEPKGSDTIDWQPEAKPANLVLHQGRDLKQRRSGLFWSRLVSRARYSEEACPSLPGVRRFSYRTTVFRVRFIGRHAVAFPTRHV
jgi:hypothetical protein